MTDHTQCPQCGGEVWNNRAKKAAGEMKPTAPDVSCKNKDGCGWKLWPPKGAKPANGAPPRKPVFASWAELGLTFRKAHSIAKAVHGDKVSGEAIQAATATIFLAAKDSGLVVPDDRNKAPTKASFEEKPPALAEDHDDGLPW